MTARRRSSIRFLAAVCTLLLLAAGLGWPGVSRAQDSSDGPETTALMVFLSYQGNHQLAISPTELRLVASRLLAARVEEGGRTVVTYPELDPVMRRWRIRSDQSLSREAMEAVAAETAADRVLVAKFVVYPDRLVALTREIEAGSGRLISAEVSEQGGGDLWNDPQEARDGWNDAVGRVVAEIVGKRESRGLSGAEETLVVLPVTRVGVAPGHSDIALHCILRSLLRSGRWSVPDPWLVRSALWAEGYDPGALNTEARGYLAENFAAAALLSPRLVAFDQGGRARGPLLDEDEYGARDIALEPEARLPLHLSLLMLDCGSGRVLAANDTYLEPEDLLGLFGIVKKIRVAARLKSGSERLVSNMPDIGGDS